MRCWFFVCASVPEFSPRRTEYGHFSGTKCPARQCISDQVQSGRSGVGVLCSAHTVRSSSTVARARTSTRKQASGRSQFFPSCFISGRGHDWRYRIHPIWPVSRLPGIKSSLWQSSFAAKQYAITMPITAAVLGWSYRLKRSAPHSK